MGSRETLGPKGFLVEIFLAKALVVKKRFGQKILGKKNVVQLFFWSRQMLGRNNVRSKKILVNTCSVKEKLGPKEFRSKKLKFEKNLGQKIFGAKEFGFQKIFWYKTFLGTNKIMSNEMMVKKYFGPKNILLSQKIGSKQLGQNWANNSWVILDMDKCHQDKFCWNKCPRNLPLKFCQKRVSNS